MYVYIKYLLMIITYRKGKKFVSLCVNANWLLLQGTFLY